jgi:hypothetical protein
MKNLMYKTFITFGGLFTIPDVDNITALHSPTPANCDFCVNMASIVKAKSNDPSVSDQSLEELVKTICSLSLSKAKRETCEVIENNIPEMRKMLNDGKTPKDVCYKIELCK